MDASTKNETLRANFQHTQGQTKVPVEWSQWLRHTRKDPPTQHEILMNEAISIRTKMRSEKVDMKAAAYRAEVTRDQNCILNSKIKIPTLDINFCFY